MSYIQSGYFVKAEEAFKHAIYLDPKFTKAYIDLAYLYSEQKKYDKAIVEWNKVLEIEPDFSEKYNVLYFIAWHIKKRDAG